MVCLKNREKRVESKHSVEYALCGLKKPMGVAQWETHITETLSYNLKDSLPSIEEIEAELRGGKGTITWQIAVFAP